MFRLAVFSLICLSLVVFLGKSYETSLRGLDSNIHATTALSVTSHGWIPRLPIPHPNPPAWKAPTEPELQGTFNDHPFFLFYLNGWILRAFGPTAWSAKLLTALFGLGSVLLTLYLGWRLRSRAFGFAAAIILVATRPFVMSSASFSLDPPLVFGSLLPIVLWQERRYLWLGLAAGVGLWLKTPVVLLVFPFALVMSGLEPDRRRELPKLAAATALALGIGVFIWIIAGLIGGRPLVADYWNRQLLGTALGGRDAMQGRELGMFLDVLRREYLPWSILLVVGLGLASYRKELRRSHVLVPLVAGGILVVFVTALRFKFSYYFLPAFPFLALLSANSVADWVERHEQRMYIVVVYLVPGLLAFLLATPTRLAPESFPGLRKFVPYIQLDGDCGKHVMVIRGHEPFAGPLDYVQYLNFYTGRRVMLVDCAEAKATLEQERAIGWVITAEENFSCLGDLSFPTQIRYGNQRLLSHFTVAAGDLTPLARELQAAVDCKPWPYPWSRYERFPAKR